MGEAILAGALARGVLDASNVTVVDIVPERLAELTERYGVRTTQDAASAARDAGAVVVAVKPQDLKSASGSVPPDALLISIMAGVTIRAIRDAFGHDRIVRVMPNTPAAVLAGMSAWTATDAVSDGQRAFARDLLAAIGEELYLPDEEKLDMATAVSGSGPAYVFLFIEAMIEGAVKVGLPRAQAEVLVRQTLLGSAQYARDSGRSAADLRAMVTSPGGTTAAGLLELERAGFRAALIDCVEAAFERAQELGAS